MSRPAGDVLAGGASVATALAVVLETRRFHVGLLTDPVGPAALPLLAAGLIGLGGVLMLWRPSAAPPWPSLAVLRRMAGALATFTAYAYLIEPLGFVLSTALVVGLLSLLFGGSPLRSMLAAVGFSLLLYVLFVYGLGLPLPVGRLFIAGKP